MQLLQRWHERLGHRNYKDVAAILGMPLPTDLPNCVACIEGKSKRRPLTGGAGPVHDGIRPGYAFGWDHAGPFAVKTWGGSNYLSLKMDMHTGKLFPVMTNSTGTCTEEWQHHVRELEAHFGHTSVVALMITDRAPYFESNVMASSNQHRGIRHV